jgi:hypothetical protein
MLVLRIRPTRGPGLVKLTPLGVLNPGLAYALGLLGLETVSASMSVLLWATEPVLIMVLAVLVLREQVAAATVTAVAAALLGVLLVIYRPGATGDPLGIVLTMGAVTACASYTVVTRRLLLDDGSPTVVLAQQVAALTFAVLVAGIASTSGTSDIVLPQDASTWALAAASGSVLYAGGDVRCEGSIPEQIAKAAKVIEEWVPRVQALAPSGRFEPRPIIPRDVWLEGLVNAVLHRSYCMAGDHVRVEIFPNRIEIENPGRFPGLTDPSKPLSISRYARNPRVVRVCSDLGIARELGEGIKRIFGEMRTLASATRSTRKRVDRFAWCFLQPTHFPRTSGLACRKPHGRCWTHSGWRGAP